MTILTLSGLQGRDLSRCLDEGALLDKIDKPFNRPTDTDPRRVTYRLTTEEVAELKKSVKKPSSFQPPYIIRLRSIILAL